MSTLYGFLIGLAITTAVIWVGLYLVNWYMLRKINSNMRKKK